MAGCRVPVSVTRYERCVGCAGAGQVDRTAALCAACGGAGTRRWARGHMVFSKACELCAGSGRVANEACRICRAVGVSPRTEVVTLTIPPGVEPGARLAVPGRGHAGALGGPPGDLYATVEVGEHPFFRRDGRDLHLILATAVHEAALGAVVDVPTLGDPIRVRIPAGTSSGESLRLRGHGVPAAGQDEAGDLVLTIELVLPPILDERSQDLLREFGRINGEDVRRKYFGQN
jgi:molecular chaperone DnaJ